MLSLETMIILSGRLCFFTSPGMKTYTIQEGKTVQKYGVNELRKMFLEFFESKGHLAMKSFSLVPHNDKSLLLINSGMAPLKPYFTGAEIPPRTRVTTCQKCIRTGDIENVGKTARHGTFFEMLGNFSFGELLQTGSHCMVLGIFDRGSRLRCKPSVSFYLRRR